MSFILDALKKSEMERQRQSVPGLVDSGVARPRPRLPAWAVALGLLLAVNLLVLLFVLTRGLVSAPHAQTAAQPRPTTPTAPTALTAATTTPTAAMTAPAGRTVAAEAAAAAGAEADGARFSPLDAPVYAPEIPVASSPDGGPASTGADSGRPDSGRPEAARPAGAAGAAAKLHRRDPLLTDEDYRANEDEVLPTINEISLTGAQALPELHLDVHVFATRPAERFVYVNMRKYHEGATLQEGPAIERIRRDGVILSYQGLRFLLPRQ